MPRARATPIRRKASTAARAFLFSDLRDYTSYVEAKGDAAAARLLREYRTLVRREVARHEGAEVKTEGDSFYVVFTSASSALECAVSILRAAEAQNARDPSMPLRIGVGLHAGETVEYDDQFVGSAVNIASRLTGKARAMELIISDTLRGLVRTSQSLPMTDRGPLDLKGVTEPIRAWSVEWRERAATVEPSAPPPPMASAPSNAPAAGQLLCPVVVGRAAETAAFDRALTAALSGAGQTVVLGGEAGVGKSKFVREAQAHATAAGARVLVGLTHQSDSALPYAPFVSAIRSGFHGLDRDELGRVLQRSAPDLAELFPELGRIERAVAPTGLERHRLTVAFQHLFRAFAREAPVLVVLEDLHWADETSLELLQHLARELRDARVLILATYRSDEMHRRHPLLRTLAELQRQRLVTEIQLKRLTPDETGELIRATFAASDPGVKVSPEFRDAVYARSEGNPFFTEELLKAIVDSGGVFWKEDGWARKPIEQLAIPGSIVEAVRARVEELSSEARDTLSAAAVIGHRFEFELLRSVTGTDDRALETRIREFIELQLVTDASGGDEEHAFRHALTREVVYDDLLVRERKRLHRAVADALERDADAEPSLFAHHLLAAGEQARALPKLLEAASRAARADAPRDAVAHFERALEIGVPDDQLPGVLEQLADAYQHFDETRSLKAAKEAAAAFEQRGDRRGRSRALRLASRQHWLRGDVDAAAGTAREAIDVVEGEECVELARALAHLSGLQMTGGWLAESVETADQAISLGERFNDPFTLANALISKGSALMGGGDAANAVALVDRGRKVALEAGLVTTAARAWNNQSLYMAFVGWSRERQLAFVREGIEYTRAHGQERSMVAWLHRGEAELLAQSGDLEGALRAWDAVRQGSDYLGPAGQTLCVLAIDGPIAVRTAAVEELARRTSGDPQQYVPTAGLATLAVAFSGDGPEARRIAETLRDRSQNPAVAGVIGGPWHALITSVALATGVHELLDVVRAHDRAPSPLANELRLAAVDAAGAIRSGDLAAAGTAFGRYWEIARQLTFDFTAAQLVMYAAIATGIEVVAQVPEWKVPLASTREFANRAKARWWLEQLPPS
ncbi:MAG: AAA family ATPase [Chloroflexota bacterium]|nr:AAA family ATPase [Chloroflexota bacterium]